MICRMRGDLAFDRLLAEGGPLVAAPTAVGLTLWSVTIALVALLSWRIVRNVNRREWGKVLASGAGTVTAAVVGSYLSPAPWHVDGRLAVSVWILAALVMGRGDPTQLAPHSVSLHQDRRPLTDDDMATTWYGFIALGLVLYGAVAWALALH
jgi:hypothetical protein